MKLAAAILSLAFLALTTVSASAFSSSFKWCGSGSPVISISDVPKGTAKLLIIMSDLDKPDFNHGGGTVTYTGQSQIPCGALTSYTGPSPPSGTHHYRIGISAMDAKGTTLGHDIYAAIFSGPALSAITTTPATVVVDQCAGRRLARIVYSISRYFIMVSQLMALPFAPPMTDRSRLEPQPPRAVRLRLPQV